MKFHCTFYCMIHYAYNYLYIIDIYVYVVCVGIVSLSI